jgi:flagellar biosynthetic protein FlhB
MPEESFQDKTEPATPKRKEEARKKGQVAKSREISSVAVLTAGVVYLFFRGKDMTMALGSMIQKTISNIPHFNASDHNLPVLLMKSLRDYLHMILPIMLALGVVAILANFLQTGFIWSVEALAPKASKIDPHKGAKRILSKRSLAELFKSIAKIVIVGWAAFSTLKEDFTQLIPLLYQEKVQIISLLGHTSMKVAIRCCWVIAILAILDYIYQKWESEQSLKMTKQEVKDEFKQTEGDPRVKSRIRSIQREMARRRMMEEVPKADVVITNPVHLAVALQYDPAGMIAPTVVAKGANKIAFRIRDLAEENHVPIIENRVLAQNLYKLQLGEEIPSRFYQAVAEILAYVYRLKRGENWDK